MEVKYKNSNNWVDLTPSQIDKIGYIIDPDTKEKVYVSLFDVNSDEIRRGKKYKKVKIPKDKDK